MTPVAAHATAPVATVPGTILNLAGNATGTPGDAGDGGPATSALFNAPSAVAVGPDDSLYIADTTNNQVRRVDTAGNVTSIAGWPNGSANDNGDGIPATGTGLYTPFGLAVDSGGNVYIADAGHNRVRKVAPDGTITNFAGITNDESGNSGNGGPATSASLTQPDAVAVSAAGEVYIADEFDHTVRVVAPDGIISDFAGSTTQGWGNSGDGGPATQALIAAPVGLAVDAEGNVYIADESYNRVRKVDANGVITDFAGSADGTYGDGGDGGPATAATLAHPSALALDEAGDLFIVDSGNDRVREVDTAGIISNVAGYAPGGTAQVGNGGDGGPASDATFTNPAGVAVDGAGDVYITDPANNRVREVVGTARVAPTFTVDHPPTSAVRGTPYRYVFTASANPRATFGVASGNLPNGLALDPDTGVLSGTPTGSGLPATFTIQASNGVASPLAVTAPISVDELPGNEPAEITSAAATTLTAGSAAAFTVTTFGYPLPTVSATGGFPAGVTLVANGDGTATLSGTPASGTGGVYRVTLTATNGIGTPAVQTLTITVDEAPRVLTPATQTFTVGVPGAFSVHVTGYPRPSLTETGPLPAGFTFDATTGSVAGAPGQGTASSYQVVFQASNGVGPQVSEPYLFGVDQAVFTQPRNGDTNFYPTQPFTWSSIPEAQGYLLAVGTKPFGTDLLVTGILPVSTTSYRMPYLPAGPPIYATLFTEVGGVWTSYDQIQFTAFQNVAIFDFPLNGATNIDPTLPFTWTPTPLGGPYILVVGTKPFGSDLVNSGVLDVNSYHYAVPILPTGKTLYTTLLTNFNGEWDRYQAISFTVGPPAGQLTHPTPNQTGVATTSTFTWSTIAGAEDYDLVVGTKPFGTNLVSSGILAPTQSSYAVAALPPGKTLYATLLTEVGGVWNYEAVTFTTAATT